MVMTAMKSEDDKSLVRSRGRGGKKWANLRSLLGEKLAGLVKSEICE